MAKKKPAPKKKSKKPGKKQVRAKVSSRAKRRAAPRRPARGSRRRVQPEPVRVAAHTRKGLGSASAGQSGDTEQLSDAEIADSESVEELVEEGQNVEAGIVEGVEDAPDPDERELHSGERPEDDVPPEYRDPETEFD